MDEVVVNKNNAKRKNGILIILVIIIAIILTPRLFFLLNKFTGHTISKLPDQSNVLVISPTPAFPMPHTEGIQILDANNIPIILQGTTILSSFADITKWKHNENPLDTLNAKTFQAIASWHMNTVTIPISQWIYEKDPSRYAAMLDEAILEAHQANLYVILSFVDTAQSGSPYKDTMLHAESVNFWQMLATHYQHDPMIFFDPMAHPSYPDWKTWRDGNNLTIRGYSSVIQAIRSAGAQQPIIIKPLSPIASDSAQMGWKTFSTSLHDTNLIYGISPAQSVIISHPNTWDNAWGPVINKYPLYYDAWEISPHMAACDGLSSTNADAITNMFLSTLANQHASWTAGDFSINHLITDYDTFTPTTFDIGRQWTCGSFDAKTAGMGETVKTFLRKSF